MGKKASALIILLIVVIVASLTLAGGGFYMFKEEQKKNLDLYDKLEEISTKQRITETKLKESEKFIADLQQRLVDAKLQIDTLSAGLKQEEAARQEAAAKLELLRTDIEQQKSLRSDLEKKLTQAQEDVRNTQAQLSDLQSQKATLESKVKDLETKAQRVELGNIVVSPDVLGPTEVVRGLEGKVLVVNKDYNFTVISLGAKDGVSLGDVFEIYHNNKYIGDVRIEKVHDSMAAAGFLNADIKSKVSEGDTVTKKAK